MKKEATQRPPVDGRELVPLKPMADRLHVSAGTLRRWVAEGLIPEGTYFVIGGITRFDPDAVCDALLKNPAEIEITNK